MRTHFLLAAVIGALALAACESNPPLGPDPATQLTVELTLSTGHIHTLSPVTFTVAVRDGRGRPVTDFETLAVERFLEGSETWRALEMALVGDVYVGEYTFTTSGEYRFRVVGMRHGQSQATVLHEMHEPMHAVRPHVEAGGYRIEFESFPGHIHEGDEATMKFWIMEQENNADGVRPPISGLAAEIHCLEASGLSEEHAASEDEPGVYAATHGVQSAGEFKAEIHFTGVDGVPAEATFEMHVSRTH